MKKLSIILLALALALVFTVPAMAIHVGDADSPEGELGITGRYQFDGEAWDVDGDKIDLFDDDMDISIVLQKGPVKAFLGLEPADTNPAEGNANKNIVDNYYVEWTAMDNLKVKIGEYGMGFAREIGTTDLGERNIQVTYMMDALDISAALLKADDGANNAPFPDPVNEDDDDTIVIMLSAKEAGPFEKLDVIAISEQNDISADENSYTGVDLALPLGPVAFAMEYGANGGDLEGNFMLFEIGLEDLVGFDLGVNYFMSSDDYAGAYDGNDWSPAMILGDQINEELADISVIYLTAGYGVNDKLNINGTAVVAAENDAGDDYGTEIDVGLKYQLADNVSYKLAYGTYSEGDAGVGSVDRTEIFWRLEFLF